MNGVALAFSRAAAGARAPVPESAPFPVSAPAGSVRDDRYRMLIGGMIWILIVQMIVPDGFDYSNLASEGAPASGSLISQLLWLMLLGGGLVVLLSRIALAWRLTRDLNVFLLAFVLLAAASVLWSIEPAITLRRMIRVVTIVLASLAFVLLAWHAQRFQSVLRPIITVVLLASIVFGLVWPQFGIHQEGDDILIGAWRGLANHKNGLGSLACVGLIFWFHGWLSREVGVLPALLGGGLAIACLILSRSSTALVATASSLLLLAMLLRSPTALQRILPYLVMLLIGALLVYSLVLLQVVPGLSVLQSQIGAITGKDATLTGRSEIWNIMTDHIALHPGLGTGYGAYWTGAYEGAASYDFMLMLNFYPGSAHNGYLEILNDLGTVGLFVLIGYIATFAWQSLRLLQVERAQAALYLALFLQQAIVNLSESRWLSALSVDFVIMTLATAALARNLLEQRRLRDAPGESQRPVYAGESR